MKEIMGVSGYFVTPNGEVFSARKYPKSGKIIKLKPMKNTNGYLVVDLRKGGGTMKSIHRIVAETFLDGWGETVNHINGDKLDNRLENLEWCSFRENQLHHFRTLKRHCGDEHWNTKLTTKMAEMAKALYADGVTKKQIAARFGVDPSLISRRVSL